jgi:hypothetical protein
LPLGTTGYGNSPYQPLSSFAGNGLVISPEWLIEDEPLAASDCEHPSCTQETATGIILNSVHVVDGRCLINVSAKLNKDNAGVVAQMLGSVTIFK